METKEFLNGFDNWHETHFEIVSAITIELQKDKPCNLITSILESVGHGGFYELAKQLTDEFESDNEGREWDGEYFETIQDFIELKFGN